MYAASSSRMPRLSVALSAGTTMSRLMRSTIFISRPHRTTFRTLVSGSAGRRLDQTVGPVLALIDHGHAPVGVVPEHEKRLVQQVELNDRIGDRHRLRVELLGLDDLELRVR